jgi:hypothetical protein
MCLLVCVTLVKSLLFYINKYKVYFIFSLKIFYHIIVVLGEHCDIYKSAYNIS